MLLMLPLGFAALWRTQGGKQKLNPSWLLGVALDMRTWYWLRRRVPGLVAQRMVNGYRIIGILEVSDYEHNAFF